MAASNDTGHLKTQAHELVKQYITYDGSSRAEYIYTVRADALNNTPCSVVRYAYIGTSSRVTYMKEYTGVWLTSFESF